MIGSDIVTNAAACCFLYCPNCFGNLNMLNIILFPAKIVYNPVFDSSIEQNTVVKPILQGFYNGAVSFWYIVFFLY